jgi:hypothetical protein
MRRWRKVRHEIEKEQHKIEFVEAAHREGVDVSWGRPSPEALKAAGKTFICMYLNSIHGFGMTKADVQRYNKAGIDIVCIFERGQEDAARGHQTGVEHAADACHYADIAGVPDGVLCFFAADFEAFGPETGPYFVGVREELHRKNHRLLCGAYGDKSLIEWLVKKGLIVIGFQTYAWSHHKWAKKQEAPLKQVLINLPGAELKIGGSTVDYCKSVALHFGQWNIYEEQEHEVVNGKPSH